MRDIYAFPSEHQATPSRSGMTLRDYFAASALQGLLSNHAPEYSDEEFSTAAYNMADSMLKAREQ